MRDRNEGKSLSAMTLEHYPGMTESELERVEAEAARRWPLQASLIVHRVGTLRPGDNIVLVVTASAHREAAFDAAEFLMDYLKTRAPFWKKEAGADGAERWVDARDSDDAAAERWKTGGKRACKSSATASSELVTDDPSHLSRSSNSSMDGPGTRPVTTAAWTAVSRAGASSLSVEAGARFTELAAAARRRPGSGW